jgi:DNA repair protein RecO (recombination protein O)
MALSDCSQVELFHLFVEHLQRIEAIPSGGILAALCHGIFHLLALAGVAPEVHRCCASRAEIVPDLLDLTWHVSFSYDAGGLVLPDSCTDQGGGQRGTSRGLSTAHSSGSGRALEPVQGYPNQSGHAAARQGRNHLTALHVALLQQLSKPELITTLPTGSMDIPTMGPTKPQDLWLRIERLLREYSEHYFERPIRSAALVDVCMTTV